MNINKISIHPASLIGRRPQNEDKHKIVVNLDGDDKESSNINFYSVFDGHGGKFVSKFLFDNLHNFFVDKKVEYPLKKNYVNKVYTSFQNVLKNKYIAHATNSGSTCLVITHFKKSDQHYLNVLNTGDSRAILCRNNIAIPLTKDHKPHYPEELSRITKLGGIVEFDGSDWRIKNKTGDLSVSRAFGDIEAEPNITCLPDIFRYKLTNSDKFFVLACDGLWDVLSNQDVVNFILINCYNLTSNERINKNINIGKKLAEYAISKNSTDNITVIVVFLDKE